MIGVVNYRMGNIRSLLNAFEALNEPVTVIEKPEQVAAVKAIVIPGVGAFGDGMENLRSAGLVAPLHQAVVEEKKPFLGVCLGMQLMAQKSYEHGEYAGLGWIDGIVEKIQPADPSLRIPHMGWNELKNINRSSPLFRDVAEPAVVYFVHSYALKPAAGSESIVTSTCDHGGDIVATVEKDAMFGAQFHPEKSQNTGLQMLRNFITICHQQW